MFLIKLLVTSGNNLPFLIRRLKRNITAFGLWVPHYDKFILAAF